MKQYILITALIMVVILASIGCDNPYQTASTQQYKPQEKCEANGGRYYPATTDITGTGLEILGWCAMPGNLINIIPEIKE